MSEFYLLQSRVSWELALDRSKVEEAQHQTLQAIGEVGLPIFLSREALL